MRKKIKFKASQMNTIKRKRLKKKNKKLMKM